MEYKAGFGHRVGVERSRGVAPCASQDKLWGGGVKKGAETCHEAVSVRFDEWERGGQRCERGVWLEPAGLGDRFSVGDENGVGGGGVPEAENVGRGTGLK